MFLSSPYNKYYMWSRGTGSNSKAHHKYVHNTYENVKEKKERKHMVDSQEKKCHVMFALHYRM